MLRVPSPKLTWKPQKSHFNETVVFLRLFFVLVIVGGWIRQSSERLLMLRLPGTLFVSVVFIGLTVWPRWPCIESFKGPQPVMGYESPSLVKRTHMDLSQNGAPACYVLGAPKRHA